VVCYLVLSHRNPAQVGRLTSALLTGAADSRVVVHHDASSCPLERSDLDPSERVELVPWSMDVRWGDWSLVQVVLDATRWIVERHDVEWLVLLSGQDYPLRPLAEIEAGLRGSDADAFISGRRLAPDTVAHTVRRYPDDVPCFKGSAWFSLRRAAIDRVLAAAHDDHELVRAFRDTRIPDEAFFHTLLFNDPSIRIVNDDRRFMRWVDGAAHPEVLTTADLPDIERTGRDFARKVDLDADPALADALDARITRCGGRGVAAGGG
jgi:hypothetical protein